MHLDLIHLVLRFEPSSGVGYYGVKGFERHLLIGAEGKVMAEFGEVVNRSDLPRLFHRESPCWEPHPRVHPLIQLGGRERALKVTLFNLCQCGFDELVV